MTKTKVHASFHLRFDRGASRALGPGKIALLEAIIDTGSISAAARRLGMSYRRAWLLVDDINSRLSIPAVEREKGGAQGGASTVTPSGKKLVRLYREIERAAYEQTLPQIRALSALLVK